MSGTLHLGTSGFAYDEWKGSFYPAAIPPKEMLPFYARRFSSVEINYTFRRLPSPTTLQSWHEAVGDGFVFAIKAHQKITHVLRLANAATDVAEFLAALAPLRERTGPILFQCPPNMRFNADRLNSFVDQLPSGHRYVFEFRHSSWLEARSLLESRGMTWCVAETDDADAPDDALATGPFCYLRLRKTDYSTAELARWAQRIDSALESRRDVFCYFKHEDAARGIRFAEELNAALAASRKNR